MVIFKLVLNLQNSIQLKKMSERKEVKPYNSNASKKEEVEAMFDNVAGRYDMLNRLLSFGVDISWRKRLIKELKKYEVSHILDMATGTADLAIMCAKSIPEVRITGIDLSSNMIAHGKEKTDKSNLNDRVELQVGDSENIQFPDDTFDGAMVAFGVRNFENLHKGLMEMNRVLKKGQPLLILEFSRPTIFPVKQVFNLYFRWVLPLIGKLFSKDPKAYSYLYESVQAFPQYDEMKQIMEETGFRNCRWHALTFGICSLYIGEK